MRLRARLSAGLAVAALAIASAPAVEATHNIPRNLTIKHSSKGHRFKGRFISPVADCRAGIVTLQRVERGPNPIVGSVVASGGRWAVRASRRGRYYAEAESFQAPGGFCPDVRSRVLEI